MQLQLPISLPVGRMLLPLEAVMVLTDRDEDQVLSLVDTGALTWAWDLRHPDAKRRMIAVWRTSLMLYLEDPQRMGRGVTAAELRRSQAQHETEVLQNLLPRSRPEVRSTELMRMWSCSSTHIHDLIGAGCFDCVNGPGRGPNGYARVTTASVTTFLRERRVC
jgi:hypothetical protein